MENCFGYNGKKCTILTEGTKCKEVCTFFKTKEQAEEGRKKALERIASLDIATQQSIAENYYNGNWPWLD